ncbi:hypothetical protein DFS33DRAFT_1381250 [Desarmillaria ectypa]|nr:hypothetical protein DFS33DRAFT_1381250 [Desarmillaria ectypa]
MKGDPNTCNFLPAHCLTLTMSFPRGYPPSNWENKWKFYSFIPGSISQTQIPLPSPLRMHMKLKCEQDLQHSGWNDSLSLPPKNMRGIYRLHSRTPCPHTPSLLIPVLQLPHFDPITGEYLHGLHPLLLSPKTLTIQGWIKTIPMGLDSSFSLPIIKLSNDSNGELDPLTLPTPTSPDSFFNPNGADYNWPNLSEVDQDLFSPFRTAAWNL